MRRLAAVDVFLTNLIQPRRVRYGLTWRGRARREPAHHLRLVQRLRHARSRREPARLRLRRVLGALRPHGLLGEPPSPPPLCRGGQGDHTTALNILAAVLAALRLRDQTERGAVRRGDAPGHRHVDARGRPPGRAVAREQPARHERTRPGIRSGTRTDARDGNWILLVMPQPDPRTGRASATRSASPSGRRDPRYDTLVEAPRRDTGADARRSSALRRARPRALGGEARRARADLGAGRDARRT